jgi:hypothetical protein
MDLQAWPEPCKHLFQPTGNRKYYCITISQLYFKIICYNFLLKVLANQERAGLTVVLFDRSCFNPILHTAWLNNLALTLKRNTAKYYFCEKSSFCIPS